MEKKEKEAGMLVISTVIHCLKEDNQHLTQAEVCLEINLGPQHLLEPIIEKIYFLR